MFLPSRPQSASHAASLAHAVSCDVNQTFGAVATGDELAILEATADLRAALPQEVYFPRPSKLAAAAELVALELKNKRLRTFAGKEKVAEVLRYLQKKAKTAEEEAGGGGQTRGSDAGGTSRSRGLEGGGAKNSPLEEGAGPKGRRR